MPAAVILQRTSTAMAGKGQPNSPHRRSRFTADKQNSRTWVKILLIPRLYLDSPGLTIGIDGVITHNGKRDKKQYHFVFDIIFRTDVGV